MKKCQQYACCWSDWRRNWKILNWTPPVARELDGGDDREQRDSGEIPVVGFDDHKLEEVESHMKSLAESLHSQLLKRIKIWPLIIAAVEAFTGDMSWVELETQERKETIASTKLIEIFNNLVGVSTETFSFDSCFPAYLVFLKFSRLKNCTGLYKLERIWELFWIKYHENDHYGNFIDLF